MSMINKRRYDKSRYIPSSIEVISSMVCLTSFSSVWWFCRKLFAIEATAGFPESRVTRYNVTGDREAEVFFSIWWLLGFIANGIAYVHELEVDMRRLAPERESLRLPLVGFALIVVTWSEGVKPWSGDNDLDSSVKGGVKGYSNSVSSSESFVWVLDSSTRRFLNEMEHRENIPWTE